MKRKSKFLSMLIPIILTFLISTSVIGGEIQLGNTTNDSFNKSKKLLERVVYKEPEHRIDLYCGCQHDEKKDVDFNSCGYQSQKNNTLAHRIEWEHAVAKTQGNINLFVDQAC